MKAFIFVSALAFVFAQSYSTQAAVIDRLEASVNSSLILLSDIQHFRNTEKLRQQLDPLFAGTPIASMAGKASNKDIVDYLVDEKLMTLQFPVTDLEVEPLINEIQTNNRIDRSQLKAAIKEQGFSFDDYFELIRVSASKRNLIERDIRTKVSISDDDVKNYFFNHYSKSSSSPTSYHLAIITISPKNYKNANAAKEVASRAAQELKSNEPLEEIIKRFSGGANSGGDLGFVSDDQMSPAIREQVKKLQIGNVSPVFGSPQSGFSVIKLFDLKTGDTDRLEKMKDEIRGQLAASEYQHQISLWLDRQRQNAFIHRAGEAATQGLPSAP